MISVANLFSVVPAYYNSLLGLHVTRTNFNTDGNTLYSRNNNNSKQCILKKLVDPRSLSDLKMPYTLIMLVPKVSLC